MGGPRNHNDQRSVSEMNTLQLKRSWVLYWPRKMQHKFCLRPHDTWTGILVNRLFEYQNALLPLSIWCWFRKQVSPEKGKVMIGLTSWCLISKCSDHSCEDLQAPYITECPIEALRNAYQKWQKGWEEKERMAHNVGKLSLKSFS